MRTITFTLLSLAAVLPLSAKPLPHPVSIPFTTNSDGMVIVSATVNGEVQLQLIFDTGAGVDVLAPSLVQKLHGKRSGTFMAFRMTGERLDIPLFVIPELAVGPMVKKNAVVGTWDALDQIHLDGIISVNNFREQPFTFDFARNVVTFETPDTMAERRAAGKSSPLRLDDQRGITLDLFARFLIGNRPGDCEIDTGTPSAIVNLSYMAPLGIEKNGPQVTKQEAHTITGASETRYNTTVPKISLESATEVSLAPVKVSFREIIYDCVVGLDFWSGKALTIDIGGKQLIVSDKTTPH